MRRIVSTSAILVLVVVVAFGVLVSREGKADGPSLVGSWRVTEDGGQPDYLLVLTADGRRSRRTAT